MWVLWPPLYLLEELWEGMYLNETVILWFLWSPCKCCVAANVIVTWISNFETVTIILLLLLGNAPDLGRAEKNLKI